MISRNVCSGVEMWMKKNHGQFFNFAKMALLNPCMKFKFFWPKVFFWRIMKMAIRIFFWTLSQGPPNLGFMQEKVKKGNFLKKSLREMNFWSLDLLEAIQGIAFRQCELPRAIYSNFGVFHHVLLSSPDMFKNHMNHNNIDSEQV